MELNEEQEKILRQLTAVYPLEIEVRRYFMLTRPDPILNGNLDTLDKLGLVQVDWERTFDGGDRDAITAKATELGVGFIAEEESRSEATKIQGY